MRFGAFISITGEATAPFQMRRYIRHLARSGIFMLIYKETFFHIILVRIIVLVVKLFYVQPYLTGKRRK
jgi:hypothetical protein